MFSQSEFKTELKLQSAWTLRHAPFLWTALCSISNFFQIGWKNLKFLFKEYMDQVSQQILWDKTPKRTSWGDFSEVLGWNDAHGITNFSSRNCVSIYPDKAREGWKELTLRKIYNWALARVFQKVTRRFENINLVSLTRLPPCCPCISKSCPSGADWDLPPSGEV